ncbi:MAG: chalcone isomerase family protein [Desulfosalsimonas sp.]|uniref:chalcone isomerase family protein n=1 Tax=Desulfosalsimonas sp. TaxID=3073848 RepID=UPI003970CC2C
MKTKSHVCIGVLLAWLFIVVCPAGAQAPDFAKQKNIDGHTLTLCGTGVLRYMVFIKAYKGAFYLEKGKTADQATDHQSARCLVLHYFHAVKAGDFAKATREMIKKNVSSDRFSSLLPKIEKFNDLYRDIKPGDRYTAAYTPESGTRLWLNDKLLGGVKGAAFAAAFFAIWIGENPIDETFRDRMLGRDR